MKGDLAPPFNITTYFLDPITGQSSHSLVLGTLLLKATAMLLRVGLQKCISGPHMVEHRENQKARLGGSPA